ncbi:hypothetical protein CXG81DRAFT_17560 [Caulochytrium protostelioides]|uniref:C2 domain-containing protein n=1 Tax=Caulochytrium protostelioides TaxID=1555241 RepID=A0A4P9XBS6_9FUNG|nr:hypothetical protein CXG81DRAFT_17560 [Caulochytrium protostelioides]|eukprot:RKP02845.1 hypothetical protein CXG81DRAFT_17560 [Caulochytrium protostelioides]
MWSRSKPKAAAAPSARTATAAPADFEINLEANDFALNDADLKDESLLAELRALEGDLAAAAPPKAKAQPPPAKAPAARHRTAAAADDAYDPEVHAALQVASDDLPDVAFTDEDMNDPELLKALQAIGGHPEPVATDDDEVAEPESAAPASARSSAGLATTLQPASEPARRAPSAVDAAAALTASAPSSASEQALSQPLATPTPPATFDAPAPSSTFTRVSPSGSSASLSPPPPRDDTQEDEAPAAVSRTPSTETMDLAPEYQVTCTDLATVIKYISLTKIKAVNLKRGGDIPSAQKALAHMKALEARKEALMASNATKPWKDRRSEYQQAALQAKRAGQMDAARQYLVTAQRITRELEALEAGAIEPSFPLPGPPSSDPSASAAVAAPPTAGAVPAAAAGAAATKGAATQPRAQPLQVQTAGSPPRGAGTSEGYGNLDGVIRQLEKQIMLCGKIAAYYLRNNDKPRALLFHKAKKSQQPDLETLKLIKDSLVPKLTLQPVYYVMENIHEDLASDELEVLVVSGNNLGGKLVSSSEVTPYVRFDLGFGDEAAPLVGETPAVRAHNPQWGLSKKFHIERNRGLARAFERKKATFDVFHSRGVLSFLRKPIPLGRAAVSLTPLLNESEIVQTLALQDPANPRRTAEGTIDIRIRLRQPLIKPEVVARSERWIVLQSHVDAGMRPTHLELPFDASGQPFASHHALATTPSDIASSAAVTTPPTGASSAPRPPSAASTPRAGASSTTPAAAAAVTPASVTSSRRPLSAAAPGTATSAAVSGAAKPVAKPPAKPPANAAAKPAAKPAGAAATDAPAAAPADREAALETLKGMFYDATMVASNAVFETEVQQMAAQIARLARLRGGDAVAAEEEREALEARKIAFEARATLLVALVNAGKLDVPTYLVQLRAFADLTRQHLRAFQRLEAAELVTAATQRLSLIEKEIAEVNEA